MIIINNEGSVQKIKPSLNGLYLFFLIVSISAQTIAAAGAEKNNKDTPVNMESAVKTAKIIVNKLAIGEKIDKSWLKINAASAIIRQYPQGKEWVIAFNNQKINKKSHQTLYIFLTLSGKYVAVNYSGQ